MSDLVLISTRYLKINDEWQITNVGLSHMKIGGKMNKLIVISGCSGGGKSTLISELKKQGYAVIEEVGRKLVKAQIDAKTGITPWEQPDLFCELLLNKSIEAYHQAEKLQEVKDKLIFFDRSILECVSHFQSINIHQYDYYIEELRYYPRIFMTPPWPKIFSQDDERKHAFEDGLAEYSRLLKSYPQYGYQIIELPKVGVKERVQFILLELKKEDLNHRFNKL